MLHCTCVASLTRHGTHYDCMYEILLGCLAAYCTHNQQTTITNKHCLSETVYCTTIMLVPAMNNRHYAPQAGGGQGSAMPSHAIPPRACKNPTRRRSSKLYVLHPSNLLLGNVESIA